MATVAAVAIGMVAADKLRVALAQRAPVGVHVQSQGLQRAPVLAGEWAAVAPLGHGLAAEARLDRVKGVVEIGPARRPVGVGEGAGLALPAGIGALRIGDLVGAHAGEEIIAGVEGADMVEAQPAPRARPVEAGAVIAGRAKLARLVATGMVAGAIAHNPSMKAQLLCSVRQSTRLGKSAYMGRMAQDGTGPVAAEIEWRLHAALSPERLAVIDDSAAHRGHAGHDPRGESHFTVEITADAFAGKSRVARHRLVNAALAELLRDRVHALAVVTRAPGEER